MADPEKELGVMVSRAIPKLPVDQNELSAVIRKILRQHYQDIQTLFAMTTDCDRLEKLSRDNEAL